MADSAQDRRLLAIVATDVVGYSRQMEADEAGTLARLKAIRSEVVDPLVAENHGQTVKLLGDGALLVFASVVDAVRCAVAIQQALARRNAALADAERTALRIGVNLGDVALVDNDVFGDGVNIAARLEQLCEPGGVAVSGTAYDHLQGKLDVALDFIGEQRVKNIARPVRVYRVRMDGARAAWRLRARGARRRIVAAAAIVLALLVAGAVWLLMPGAPAVAGRPSIAVLPFESIAADPAMARLAGGLTEDIITDLSRFRDFDVIARNSTGIYAGKAVDIREVAKRLGVRYVLEGSVQRQADEIRVTAQLVSGETGARVWSERWDRPIGDVFAVQTEIAEQVANRLGGWGLVTEAERVAARARPAKVTVYEKYLQALDEFEQTEEGAALTIARMDEILEEDPTFARAWVVLSFAHGLKHRYGLSAQGELEASIQAAERAIQLDPMDASAYAALGDSLGWAGDFARAAAAFESALRLNPGSAEILTFYAGWASPLGQPERGAEAADRAIRLNPNHGVGDGNFYRYAYFMAGRYEDALRVIERQPPESLTTMGMVLRGAVYAALGRTEEARSAVAEALARHPDLTIEGFVNEPAFIDAERQRLVETMRSAGFPPCAPPQELAALDRPLRLPECG